MRGRRRRFEGRRRGLRALREEEDVIRNVEDGERRKGWKRTEKEGKKCRKERGGKIK